MEKNVERLCAGFIFPPTPLGQLGFCRGWRFPTTGTALLPDPSLFLPFSSFVEGVCQFGLQPFRLGAGVEGGAWECPWGTSHPCGFFPWPEAQCGRPCGCLFHPPRVPAWTLTPGAACATQTRPPQPLSPCGPVCPLCHGAEVPCLVPGCPRGSPSTLGFPCPRAPGPSLVLSPSFENPTDISIQETPGRLFIPRPAMPGLQ